MHETLNTLRADLARSLSGLSDQQTQTRPAPDKWSIQQIVEHLLLSYAATSNVVEARLAKRTPTKAAPTPAQRLGQFMITRLGWFPKGRKAPPAVTPPQPERALSGAELMEDADRKLATMDAQLTQAEALFGNTPAISHIVLGPMAVPRWRRFHLIHGRHHLRQIAVLQPKPNS